MAKNELLPFANGVDANILPTNQWEALTDILKNGFQSGIARSEQVNRVLAQGAVASYVLGQLIVDQLNKDATLDKDTLYQNIVKALQENAKDACLPLSGGTMTGTIKQTNQFALSRTTDDTRLEILGGTSAADGASLYLDGVNSFNEPGTFSLTARDNNGNIKQLRGEPNGSLTWGGKDVITSAGGTVDNVLYVAKHLVITPGDNGEGGELQLCSPLNTNATEICIDQGVDGQYRVFRNGVVGQQIDFLNKAPYFFGSRAITLSKPLVPDYNAVVSITSPFTAPSAGVVILTTAGNGRTSHLKVNGVTVGLYNMSGSAYLDSTCFAWVSKGDVCTFTVGGSSQLKKFYPLKVGD